MVVVDVDVYVYIKVFVNLYSAFKAPTLFELFDPLFGNVGLDPEQSFNVEAGAQWSPVNDLTFRSVFFHRDTRDAIEFIYTDPVNYISQYRNVSRARSTGIELEAEYKTARWNISANFTHMKGKVISKYDNTGFPLAKDTTINNLYRTPANVLNASGGIWINKKLYTGGSLRVAGDRLEPIYASAPVVLDRYYTIDVYAEYKFSDGIRAFADVKNITDQEYFEVLGYNTRGANFMAGVRLTL